MKTYTLKPWEINYNDEYDVIVAGGGPAGCAAAIASASMLSTMAIGKSLEEAKQLTGEVIVAALGGLPEAKLHCAALAADALQEAIKVYEAEHM